MRGVIALLYLLPALVLIVAMLLRRYPGERCLLRLAARRRGPRSRRTAVQPWPGRRRALPRGGLLIACSLAVRPPPAARSSAT